MILRKGDKVKILGRPKDDYPIPDYKWPDEYDQFIGSILEVADVAPRGNGDYYEIGVYNSNNKRMDETFYDFELEPFITKEWDD